jgi:hypothetical protein
MFVLRVLLGALANRLLAPHLLGLQILVEKEESRLIGLGSAHDRKHALACLVVGRLIILVRTQHSGDKTNSGVCFFLP